MARLGRHPPAGRRRPAAAWPVEDPPAAPWLAPRLTLGATALAAWLSTAAWLRAASRLAEAHAALANPAPGLAVLHLLGVALACRQQRAKLVRAMIAGRQRAGAGAGRW